jgi:hypothetical protein
MIDLGVTIVFPITMITITNITIYFKLIKYDVRDRAERRFSSVESCFNNQVKLHVVCANVENSSSSSDEESHNQTRRGTTMLTYFDSRMSQQPLEMETTRRQSLLVNNRSIVRISKALLNYLKKKSDPSVRARVYERSTKTLLIVSGVFILFNILMVYSRTRYLFQSDSITFVQHNATFLVHDPIHVELHHEIVTRQLSDQLIDKLACFLYYLNYSCNFFFYILNGAEFRNALFRIMRNRFNIWRCQSEELLTLN